MKNYAQILIELRAKHDWSQGDLAQKIGVTQQTISAIEAGGGANKKTAAKIDLFLTKIVGIEARPDTTKNKETTLGGRVNIHREVRNITREELAKACGFSSPEQVRLVENNEMLPSQQQISLLARTLGQTESYLVDGPRYKESQERMDKLSEAVISGGIRSTEFSARNESVIGLAFKLINQYNISGEILNGFKAIDNDLKDKDAQIIALQQKLIDCQNELIDANKEGRAQEATPALGGKVIVDIKKEMVEP